MKINQIIQGDCSIVMKKISNNFIDLILTSPPYDNLRNYNGYNFNFEKIIKELFRVLKDGGVVVWIVSDATIKGSETGTSFKQALYFKKVGFNLHDTMIYQKDGLTMNHRRYEQEFEYMFVFTKNSNSPKTFNPIKVPCKWHGRDGDRSGQFMGKHGELMKRARSEKQRSSVGLEKIKGNVWKYNTGHNHSTSDEIAFEHPATFPEQLARDHILSWSNEGDLVLDPMCGSGTTCKIAKVNNRNFIGIEISKNYCRIARERLRQRTLL